MRIGSASDGACGNLGQAGGVQLRPGLHREFDVRSDRRAFRRGPDRRVGDRPVTASLRIPVHVLAMVAAAVVACGHFLRQLPHVAIAAFGDEDPLACERDQQEGSEDAGGF